MNGLTKKDTCKKIKTLNESQSAKAELIFNHSTDLNLGLLSFLCF